MPVMLGVETLAASNIRPQINRLTLNVSNACNLWCSYCNADHGYYHSEKSLMPVARAEAIVSRVMEMYAGVSIVHFFGGEPLLNLKAIDAVGQRFQAAIGKGQWAVRPSFVATTNGTLSSTRVLDVLERWKIELTVSWDGPKVVQDSGRPLVGQGSSHDKLLRSLERFKERRIPYTVECTYNAAQLVSRLCEATPHPKRGGTPAPSDRLKAEEDMVVYLEATLEEGDAVLVAAALGDIPHAKGMTPRA